ncbi:P97 family adhesin [Mesomycoplasma ovipneumoniae]|uniref:P97 family adhesin n=2 Tax=Mesomycoplasma ovipneumoniae TaxID=29562 RepID=UPI003080B41E
MNKLSKSKTLLLVGTSGLIGIGVIGLTIGLTLNIKYNAENPRTQVNQFASRVSNLAFNLGAFHSDSDYNAVKTTLLDGNNKIKNAENALESFSFFEKKDGNLKKLDFSDSEFSDAKISYQILEILPDDANQNFKVKFQASQKLQNGDVAKSDIYEQVVSFVKESTILIAEFNFSLQQITNRLSEQVKNLVSAKVTNFSDQNLTTSNPTDPSIIRPVDFQHDLNKSKDSKEFGAKISSYFPSLKNLLVQLKSSQENKLPNSIDTIFDFDFARDKSNGQFVSLQNQVPSFFLQATLTSTARQMLDSSSSFAPIVSAVKLEKSNNGSYFLDYSDFFDNLNLKNLTKTDLKSTMGGKLAVEFLAKIKSGFFSDPTQRSESAKSEILELLTDKKIPFDFGKFGQKFKNHNTSDTLKVSFDPLEAKIDAIDKTKVLIPYSISVNNQFFMPSNTPLEISQKTGTLEISGLKQLENLGQLNSDIFKNRLEGLGKENNQKQAVFDQYGLGIRSSSRKVAKEEIDALFANNSPKTNEIRKILESNYDLDFGPYISLLDSWVGKIKHPSLSEIQRLTKDETQSTRTAGVSSIETRNFFRDGHQVASFFQDLLTKNRKTLLETLFELTKRWGLIAESTQIPQSLLDSKDNIFEEANKISLTSTSGDIKKLSFNSLWRDTEGIGFYGTLVLPTSIKTEIGKKKGDSSIFDYLKTQKVMTKPNESTTTNTTEDYAKFEKFGDVLSAFFLKAGQFDNFKAWAKLDDNLKYTLEFTKEAEQAKEEVSKKIQEVGQAEKAEGSQNQGKKAEGAQNQGKKVEGAQNQGKKVEGAQNQGKKAEGAQNQGKKVEGAQNQGKKAEGAQNQGKKAEGAQNQGKKAEGAQDQGKKEQVLPVKFSFKLESNDGSILNVKTPEIKVFLELEDETIYKSRKEINELDKAVIQLQNHFRETSLDSSKYSSLTFPMKVEGTQNQGKKAEGAQNQGKKAEGAQNQGKKVEGAQNQGKKAEGAQNQGKKAEGAQNQGKKAEGAQNQGKKAEGAQNQGKKAEGAQNQGKKAEGTPNQGKANQNSLKSYLPELGKKVDEYLETHFKDKNYKTLVESISDSFGKTTKELFFVLVKEETSSTSDSGSSTTTATPQKRSTLRVKITISESKNTTTTPVAESSVSSSS